MNQLISNGGDCRTAPATPGLLKKFNMNNIWSEIICHPLQSLSNNFELKKTKSKFFKRKGGGVGEWGKDV